MRCYNGYIPESDYKARYGYTQSEYYNLLKRHPTIRITYFPLEGKYSACFVEGKKTDYNTIDDFHSDKMSCLKSAIKIKKNRDEK